MALMNNWRTVIIVLAILFVVWDLSRLEILGTVECLAGIGIAAGIWTHKKMNEHKEKIKGGDKPS